MSPRRPAAALTSFSVLLVGLVLGPPSGVAKVPGPNGQIAYARNVPALDDTISFTIDPDGTHRRRLFPGASEFPHWSPDGERVAILACVDPPICRTAAVIVDPQTGD